MLDNNLSVVLMVILLLKTVSVSRSRTLQSLKKETGYGCGLQQIQYDESIKSIYCNIVRSIFNGESVTSHCPLATFFDPSNTK